MIPATERWSWEYYAKRKISNTHDHTLLGSIYWKYTIMGNSEEAENRLVVGRVYERGGRRSVS